MSETFHRVVEAAAVEERAMVEAVVNRWPVVVTREEGRLHAFINRCTHAAATLAPEGRIRRGSVMCPLHGARFKLDTGECMGGVAYGPIKIFPIRETDDGWIEVSVPDVAPGPEHTPVKTL